MIKRLLALALIATPALASAQTSVTATASVAATATLSVASNIDFGAVTPGSLLTLAPNAAGAGRVNASFNTTTATVTVPTTVLLTNTTYAGATMTANLSCNTDGSATAGACGAQAAFNYNGSNAAMATGSVYIGGNIPAANSAGARVGTYNGSISVTIANSGV